MKQNFKGKNMAILGAGVEGLSSAKFFIKKGARVTVLDAREEKEIEEGISELKDKDLKIIKGKDYLNNLSEFDIIVRSPGIRLDLKEFEGARKKGIQITSQIKIFFEECPSLIIGVTGTKGKGTTATLIYEMLKKSFDSAQDKHVYLGGNIGRPPLDFLDKLNPQSIVVLELSSFQLQDLNKSPHIAVMLMVTSEHLDYHKDVYEYISAKRNILRFQSKLDVAVINRDYVASNESDIYTEGKVYKVSRERETENGCFVKDKKVWVKLNGNLEEIIDTEKILIPGAHNFENVCAAVMVAKVLKVSNKNIVSVLTTFKGLEHRIELVKEVKGVKYYDDSFSTTPETAIAAIEAFKNQEILILGGSSKKSDFMQLGDVISKAENIRAIIGIGVEWERMKAQFPISNFQFPIVEGAKDMRTIVLAASKIAKPGDVVLLSPACASFDMFRNYKDRGDQFKKEVEKL